jgi:hypothetical protein
MLSVAKRFHERTRWLVMLMGPGLLRLPIGLTPGELSQRLWEALRRHYGDEATILGKPLFSYTTPLVELCRIRFYAAPSMEFPLARHSQMRHKKSCFFIDTK